MIYQGGINSSILEKSGLMKHHMARDVNTTSGDIKATIYTMRDNKPQKNIGTQLRVVGNLCAIIKVSKG